MKRIAALILICIVFTSCAEAQTPYTYTPTAPDPLGQAGQRLETAQTDYATTSAIYTATASQATAVSSMATEQAQASATAVSGTSTAVSGTSTAVFVATVTAVSATGTAVQQEKLDALVIRATTESLDATATGHAIASGATAVAVANVAKIEADLIEDEAARVATQRENERLALEYTRILNSYIKPLLWAAFIVAAFVLVYVIADRIWHQTRPVFDRGGALAAIPPGHGATIPGFTVTRQDVNPPALLAPPTAVIPLPNAGGHVLVASNSGGGKTILLRNLVDQRGDNVMVLDPHYMPGAWGLARVMSDYPAMENYLDWLVREIETRKTARRTDSRRDFPPLTVATEEMPIMVAELGKEILKTWKRIMREGRKFNINMIVVTQSTRVETLGIKGEGDLLKNFNHIIHLGTNATDQFSDLTAVQQRPAIMLSDPHYTPTPITIPYDPRMDTEDPRFIPFFPYGPHGLDSDPIDANYITTTEPGGPASNDPIQSPHGPITKADAKRIVDLAKELPSRRQVSATVYGTAGGPPYQKVKFILDNAVGPA